MDTVEGLTETADLMSTGFANYFDDINDWEIKNEIAPRSTEIRNKIVWHKNTPMLYPHFADVWFKATMTRRIARLESYGQLTIDNLGRYEKSIR